MIGILLLVLHFICCIVVYIGIRSHILKIKVHMMPFVIFVPVTGLLCCLFLHFQLFLKQDARRINGVEKLKVQEEIYQGIFAENTSSYGKVVSVEEALLINDSGTRRNLMMDVLNDHPEEYIDVLMLARMNEDVEVVHYATTALAELSKRYDAQLLQLEAAWKEHPGDGRLLDEYTDFLQRYLKQGIAEGQHERDQRRKYAALLQKQMDMSPSPKLYHALAENALALEEYSFAESMIGEMEERWPYLAECRMMKIELYARSGQGEALQRELQNFESENIYISHEDRKKLEFWESPKKRKADDAQKNGT